jgi:hypothetical protein
LDTTDPTVFRKLQAILDLQEDLISAKWNRQLDLFTSWQHQPDVMAVDSFSLNWSLFLGYAFTPFYLIHRCLNKIKKDRVEMILVALIWQVQPWYPVFMSLVCEPPQILPKWNGACLIRQDVRIRYSIQSDVVISRLKIIRERYKVLCISKGVAYQKARGTVGVLGVFARVKIPCLLV